MIVTSLYSTMTYMKRFLKSIWTCKRRKKWIIGLYEKERELQIHRVKEMALAEYQPLFGQFRFHQMGERGTTGNGKDRPQLKVVTFLCQLQLIGRLFCWAFWEMNQKISISSVKYIFIYFAKSTQLHLTLTGFSRKWFFHELLFENFMVSSWFIIHLNYRFYKLNHHRLVAVIDKIHTLAKNVI